MKTARTIVMILLALSLSACLEVEQHPPWLHGYYDGKPDNMPFQRNFHNDRLAWNAAIDNRNRHQNEYNRMR
jgi:hypothetical protein